MDLGQERMSHVATVQVWRCGCWLDPDTSCRGTEHGCADPTCSRERDFLGDWLNENGEPLRCIATLTHAEFLRDYGRCPTGPRGCRVAEQLTLEA